MNYLEEKLFANISRVGIMKTDARINWKVIINNLHADTHEVEFFTNEGIEKKYQAEQSGATQSVIDEIENDPMYHGRIATSKILDFTPIY